jgi:serine/threonine protein kinase
MSAIPSLDGYEFIKPVGGGFYAEVWKARHKALNQLRAVKILRPDDRVRSSVDRLLAEARRMVAMEEHAHLVRLTFTLTEPAGYVSFFLVWHRRDLRATPHQWRQWLDKRSIRVRGAKIVDHRVSRLPEKAFDYQEVVVAHHSPPRNTPPE